MGYFSNKSSLSVVSLMISNALAINTKLGKICW